MNHRINVVIVCNPIQNDNKKPKTLDTPNAVIRQHIGASIHVTHRVKKNLRLSHFKRTTVMLMTRHSLITHALFSDAQLCFEDVWFTCVLTTAVCFTCLLWRLHGDVACCYRQCVARSQHKAWIWRMHHLWHCSDPLHTISRLGLSKLYQHLNRHCRVTVVINLSSKTIRILGRDCWGQVFGIRRSVTKNIYLRGIFMHLFTLFLM